MITASRPSPLTVGSPTRNDPMGRLVRLYWNRVQIARRLELIEALQEEVRILELRDRHEVDQLEARLGVRP